eukprot:763799-Prymnesium_polylepis.1
MSALALRMCFVAVFSGWLKSKRHTSAFVERCHVPLNCCVVSYRRKVRTAIAQAVAKSTSHLDPDGAQLQPRCGRIRLP